MSDDDELHVLRNSESLAEVERDRLRARVAELERQRDERLILPVKLCRDCDTAPRMLIDGVTIAYCCPQCYAADDIQITAEKDAPVLGVETDPGTYEVTADTTSVAASGPRTNETRPDVEASAADEWGPDDIFDLPSLGKVVGEYVGVPKARHDAEQAVVEAAKAWRAAMPWHTGVPRDAYADRLADTQGALIAVIDALIATVDALSTSQRDRQEASECDHWMHKLDLPRGTSMSFTTEAHEDLLAHRQVCPLLARGSSPSSSTEEKGQR